VVACSKPPAGAHDERGDQVIPRVLALKILLEHCMANRPPLLVHLLAHPRSKSAQEVAEALRSRFVEPPASGGLRVPVFFTPDKGDGLPPAPGGGDGLELDAAQHTLVVVLADAIMLRTIPSGTGKQWRDFVERLREMAPLDASPHHVLPVALDDAGSQIGGSGHVLPAAVGTGQSDFPSAEWRLSNLSFHIAARAIQLLEHGKVPATKPHRMQAPVRLFLSHAKADLKQDDSDPVGVTHKVSGDRRFVIDKWFDSNDIAPGQDFAKAIEAGLRDCSIMLAFQTDQYSARPWCRREVLEAKRAGAHILVVDALNQGEQRSFPYGANLPVLRWNAAANPEEEARRVIDRVVLEALRFKHNRAQLQGLAEAGDQVLAAPPEALTLADAPVGSNSYLYPDPPLGREELEVLEKLRPGAQFTTPLTRLAARHKPRAGMILTVAISESGDAPRYGLDDTLVTSLSDEIHLYLLLAGLKIAYGGALSGDFRQGGNFTLRLFELVRTYSRLAEGVSAPPIKGAVINVAPWPLRLNYGDEEWKLFDSDIAKYEEGPRANLTADDEALFPHTGEKFDLKPDKPAKRHAWACGLSAMRRMITDLSDARLVLGGKLTGFSGLVPGVVEEACLSLAAGKPLFLAGGYGGAARAVCDLLLGKPRDEFTDAWQQAAVPDFAQALACHPAGTDSLALMPALGTDIAAQAGKDLGAVLKNGLNDAENRELMASTDARTIAELVLRGLAQLSAAATQPC
jgi:SLOG-like protein/TIR domain-containing protein